MGQEGAHPSPWTTHHIAGRIVQRWWGAVPLSHYPIPTAVNPLTTRPEGNDRLESLIHAIHEKEAAALIRPAHVHAGLFGGQ